MSMKVQSKKQFKHLAIICQSPPRFNSNQLEMFARKTVKGTVREYIDRLQPYHSLVTVDQGAGLWSTAQCYHMGIPYTVVNPYHEHITNQKDKGHKARCYMNRAIQTINLDVQKSAYEILQVYATYNELLDINPKFKKHTQKIIQRRTPFLVRNKWMIDQADIILVIFCSHKMKVSEWTRNYCKHIKKRIECVCIENTLKDYAQKVMKKSTSVEPWEEDDIPF